MIAKNKKLKYFAIMFRNIKILFVSAIAFSLQTSITVSSLNSSVDLDTLRVFIRQYEPYVYRNDNGEFESGLEYELIKVIGKKLGKKIIHSNISSLPCCENQKFR